MKRGRHPSRSGRVPQPISMLTSALERLARPGEGRRRGIVLGAVIAGGWLCFGLFSFAQSFLYYALPGAHPESPMRLLALAMGSASIWALLTPAALWISNRIQLTPERLFRSLALHFLVGIGFVLVSTVLERGVARLVAVGAAQPFARSLLYRFDSRLLAYLLIVTLAQVGRYLLLFREREQQAAALATQLARAELQVLKMQLQPHFLFNALNSISELVHRDPRSADRLIARLGHLLRLSLDQAAGHQMVPLRQELEFLKAYLEIEQTRFRDRLSVELDVEPDVLDAAVPTLLLQPLVENAIRHGVAPRPAGGCVTFHAVRQGDRLAIEVRDDGPGFPASPAGFAEGLGIRNTRERLRQLFGESHGLRFENPPGGGARVAMELPFRECHQANTPLHLRTTPRLAALSV